MTSAVSSMIVADRKMFRTTATVAFALGLAVLPGVARADDGAKPGPRAEALFKEARVLLDQKKFDEACPKLAESQRLDPGAGTLLALALCHEGQGKTATAWAELDEAAKLGRKVGRQDLAAAADKRARAMEPQLAKLVIRMPKDAAGKPELEAVQVRVDGAKIASEDFGAPFAVDPGEHKVEVSAKAKVPRSYTVRLSGAGTVEIVVDKLDDVAAPAPVAEPVVAKKSAPVKVSPLTEPPPVEAETASRGGAQRTFGAIVAGLGVVGLGAGAYFGGKALSEQSQSRCNGTCTQDNNDAKDRAKQSTTNAIISVTSGTVAIATGAIIYLTAPSSNPSGRVAAIVPQAGPQQAGVGVVGTF